MTINIYCCHEDCNVVSSEWNLSVHTKSFDPFNLKTGKKNQHSVALALALAFLLPSNVVFLTDALYSVQG